MEYMNDRKDSVNGNSVLALLLINTLEFCNKKRSLNCMTSIKMVVRTFLEFTFYISTRERNARNLSIKLLSFVNITCLWILNIIVLSNTMEYLGYILLIFDYYRDNIWWTTLNQSSSRYHCSRSNKGIQWLPLRLRILIHPYQRFLPHMR